jgi:pyruvate/2-oxoglutarate dehydrogenase complex dihydrolipoamide acyltransferase (E2) component
MPPTDVVMPQMGESLAEGTVVRWLKAPGERVARDEPLFEISTDKVDTEVPSPVAGTLREILVGEGQTVEVGTPVARIEEVSTRGPERRADSMGEPAAAPPAAAESPSSGHFRTARPAELVAFRRSAGARAAAPPARPESRQAGGPRSRVFSPAVLDAARRGGVPLETLTALAGSGRGGRITKKDVEAYLRRGARAPIESRAEGSGIPPEFVYRPGPDDRCQPMSPVRRRIAHHMSWSVRISPHATAFAECDMSRASAAIAAAREAFAASVGAPLTYTVIAAQASVAALADHPTLNASVVGDDLVLKPYVNLGIAVALADTGELIVPVVRGAHELSLAGLARAVHDLAARARDRALAPEDVQGGTFTLTNPGVFGGLTGTPILNQPQVAILGLGAVTRRPVAVGDDDRIAVRPVMTLSLTFDHRAADGMVAFRYLESVRKRIEGFESPVA